MNCKDLQEYVVFDLETTGLDYSKDAIIEIGAVKVREAKVVDTFASFIHYPYPLHPFIKQLTGINESLLVDAPEARPVLEGFLNFATDLPLMGHNARSFDMPFVNYALRRENLESLTNPLIDTIDVAKSSSLRFYNYKLKTLVNFFHITHVDAHRAIGDAMATYQVFERLRKYI
jgi:DNA polymerase-3 subunit alpha (Gram-positive type)